jgi:hypothetical protein
VQKFCIHELQFNACHPDGLRFLQAGGPMQSRPARTLKAELHGSSGAKERRHQDDNISFHSNSHPLRMFGLTCRQTARQRVGELF